MSPRSSAATTTGPTRSPRRSTPRSTGRAAGAHASGATQPYQQAQRKRAAARRMRRFEDVMGRLPGASWARPDIGGWLRRIEVPAAVRPTPWRFSKVLSALILAATLYAVVAVHTQDEWFVYAEDVDFGSLAYLAPADLYALSEVEGWNILWIQPQVLAEHLHRHPWVAAATVQIRLPGRVAVQVQERTPVAVWVTNQRAYWLAASGAALPMPAAQAAAVDEVMLPQIIDSLGEARQLGVQQVAIAPSVLESALALTLALPELEGKVRYNQGVGLNFPLSNPAVWVYLCDGHDMATKLENLAALHAVVQRDEDAPRIIDLCSIHRPYVR